MNITLGADTQALRALEGLFTAGAQGLQQTADTALRRADVVDWVGPDADEFRTECHHLLSRVQDVQDTVRAWGEALADQAEEQEQVSGDSGSGGGSGSGPGRGADGGTGDGSRAEQGGPGGPDWFNRPVVDQLEKVLDKVKDTDLPPGARKALKFIPIIPDVIHAGYHYGRGETAEGNWAVVEGLVGATPYLGTAVDIADLLSSGQDGGSLLERMEKGYVDHTSDPDSAISRGEQEGLRKADELGIENPIARNVLKVVMGNGRAWQEGQGDRNEDGSINPFIM